MNVVQIENKEGGGSTITVDGERINHVVDAGLRYSMEQRQFMFFYTFDDISKHRRTTVELDSFTLTAR